MAKSIKEPEITASINTDSGDPPNMARLFFLEETEVSVQRLVSYMAGECKDMIQAIVDEDPEAGESLAPDIAVRLLMLLPKGPKTPPQAVFLLLAEAMPMLGNDEMEIDADHVTDAQGYLWSAAADFPRDGVRLSRTRDRFSLPDVEEEKAINAAVKVARRRLHQEWIALIEAMPDHLRPLELPEEVAVPPDDVLSSPEVATVRDGQRRRVENFFLPLTQIESGDFTLHIDEMLEGGK